MTHLTRSLPAASLALAATILLAPAARADLVAVATYEFKNSLAADQGGAPSLTATNPLGTNGFQTDTLYGQTRTVYAFNGTGNPATSQAGLTANTTGLISPTNYSAEVVFSFSQNDNAWRRIIDVQNRASDTGFYVDPSNHLDLYNSGAAGSTAFTENAYHDVVLTVSGGTTVSAYLDGKLEFTVPSSLMNITDTTDNPNNLMNFFLDNTVGGGIGEFSSGKVGLIQLFNGVLDQSQITTMANNPFANLPSASVPEPSTLALAGLGLAAVALMKRRKRARV